MNFVVSIIVPIYNVEPYLAQCTESIRNQTVKEIEIILIDDGSTDGCPEMCDRFAAEDKRIRVFHQKNAGVSAARNRGMEIAAGEWLMFVDPDDWLEPNAVEVLYGQAKESGCDIGYASYYQDYPGRQERFSLNSGEARKYIVEQELETILDGFTLHKRLKTNMASPWGKIYRKSMLDTHMDCRFPDGMKMGEDLIFNLYAVQNAGSISIVDVPVYHYRERVGSTSCVLHPDQQERYLRLIDEIHGCMEKYQLLDQFISFYYFICAQRVFYIAIRYGKAIRGRSGFRAAVLQLKTFCEIKRIEESIRNARLESVSGKAVLWLLRHHLYAWVMLLAYAGGRLFPEALP